MCLADLHVSPNQILFTVVIGLVLILLHHRSGMLLNQTFRDLRPEQPLKFVAFGHAFRCEAGNPLSQPPKSAAGTSYHAFYLTPPSRPYLPYYISGGAGRATRGLYRVHQFSKVELFAVCTGDIAESEALHDAMLAEQEAFFASLDLHFRTLDMPTEELGAPGVLKKHFIFGVERRKEKKNGFFRHASAKHFIHLFLPVPISTRKRIENMISRHGCRDVDRMARSVFDRFWSLANVRSLLAEKVSSLSLSL